VPAAGLSEKLHRRYVQLLVFAVHAFRERCQFLGIGLLPRVVPVGLVRDPPVPVERTCGDGIDAEVKLREPNLDRRSCI
jgi:hypothetical protein